MTKEQLQKMAHEYVTNHRDAEVRGMYGDHYRTYMAAAQAILACQQQQSDAVELQHRKVKPICGTCGHRNCTCPVEQSDAVEFAEWCPDNGFTKVKTNGDHVWIKNDIAYTSKTIYEIFKKEKL